MLQSPFSLKKPGLAIKTINKGAKCKKAAATKRQTKKHKIGRMAKGKHLDADYKVDADVVEVEPAEGQNQPSTSSRAKHQLTPPIDSFNGERAEWIKTDLSSDKIFELLSKLSILTREMDVT